MVHPRQRRRAFTLVELLVVIGIIAVLIAVLLPALNKARQAALKVNCASNLRNLGQACVNYAVNNRGWLPAVTDRADWNSGLAGNWLWDISVRTRDALVRYGAERHTLYCPSYKEQDVDGLWNYAGITVGGYSYLWERVYLDASGHSVTGNLRNKAGSTPGGTVPNVVRFFELKQRPKYLRSRLGEKPATDLEMAADTILSQNQDGPPFSVPGGYSVGDFRIHNSSHLGKDGFPLGQNTLYLDGHVTWREFSKTAVKANQIQNADIRSHYAPGGGAPFFWW